ncbi:MAG: helix-turn-helix domain-containing protein [Verrucomicrobia bacterium]|jgi:transcriptional regulator GlxA family with amidase domain|nr:helix-turn-helix domain-containing protein [Verrucomicrobiota bacterium]|tara:strand:- start:713 stop:910 length:198 start_codon:yes stop_codon:yes gene_type:complete
METRIPKQRAADLLSTTNLRIKDIVIACGFSSSHQFERAIKKMYGMNPTEFRRQKLRASGAGELS